VKVLLEPMSEYFLVRPGERIEIHGIFDSGAANSNFTIAPNDGVLTVYSPGDVFSFVDHYVTKDGLRLLPDGN
jgi:hypothetical protein